MNSLSTRALFLLGVMLLQIPGFAQQSPQFEIVPQTSHYGIVSIAQVSHDGKYFVTGTYSRAILWETASGRQLRSFPNATAVAFSGNGKFLATGHFNIDLWDVVSGERLRTITPRTSEDGPRQNPEYMPQVEKLVLSDDGKFVAAWKSYNNQISVWETATGQILRTLDVGAKPNQETPPLVLGSDGKLKLAGGGKIGAFRRKRQFSTCSALSADGKVVAVGYRDGTTKLWSTVDDRELHSLNVFKNRFSIRQVTSVALSGDGQILVTCFNWGMVIVWDAATGKKLHVIPPDPGCSVIGLSGDGKSMCTKTRGFIQTSYSDSDSTALLDETVRLWDLTNGTSRFAFSTDAAHGVEPENKAPEGDEFTRVLSCGPQPTVMWLNNRNNNKRLEQFATARLGGYAINELFGYPRHGTYAISADGTRLASSGIEGYSPILWDMKSGKTIRTFGIEFSGNGVALNADAGLLAIADLSRTSLWDTATGRKLRSVEGGFHGLALTPDGKHLYTRGKNKSEVHLWDTASGRNIRTFQTGAEGTVIPTPDNRFLVTGSPGDYGEEPTATLWDVATGNQLQVVQGRPIAVSPDGKQLWTADRLWDLTTGQVLCRLYSFDVGREWLVVTPEGLVDGSENAWRHVVFRVPGTLEILDDKETFQRYHRPGLLARLWNLESYRGYVQPAAVEMPPLPTVAEMRQERMKTIAASHEVVVVGSNEKAKRIEDPIFSWDTPEGRSIGGALYLWTLNGRPAATIELWTSNDIKDGYKFHSLHEGTLDASSNSSQTWNSKTPGIRFQPLPKSDPPAEDKSLRLIQMQAIAQDRFMSIIMANNAKTHLKLMPEPIYRYQELPRDVLDGAMFAFAMGDDPECVLIFEARIIENKPQWFYAFGSQTTRRVDCKLDNIRVWSNDTPGDADKRRIRPMEESLQRSKLPAVDTTETVGPAAPVLIEPHEGATLPQPKNGSWRFDWDDVPHSTNYEILVRGLNAKTPLVRRRTKESSLVRPTSNSSIISRNQRGWTWRVRAMDRAGHWGDWSEERTFDVAP